MLLNRINKDIFQIYNMRLVLTPVVVGNYPLSIGGGRVGEGATKTNKHKMFNFDTNKSPMFLPTIVWQKASPWYQWIFMRFVHVSSNTSRHPLLGLNDQCSDNVRGTH